MSTLNYKYSNMTAMQNLDMTMQIRALGIPVRVFGRLRLKGVVWQWFFSLLFPFFSSCPSLAKRIASSFITSCKCTRHPLSIIPRPINIVALCWKNMMQNYRNPGLLIFQFIIPTFQVILFILAIGRNLEGIKVAYTNDDTRMPFGLNLSSLCNNTDIDNGLVGYSDFGELYISKLQSDNTFRMVSHTSWEWSIYQISWSNLSQWRACFCEESCVWGVSDVTRAAQMNCKTSLHVSGMYFSVWTQPDIS